MDKMKPAPIPSRPDDSRLEHSEVTDFRSALGALLWVSATRLDLVADVSLSQSKVTTATVKELKMANEVLVKAKDCREAALHYRRFQTPHQRLVCIHDASSANNGRHYAQEGILVLLADDHWRDQTMEHEVIHDEESVKMHGGVMHVLHAHGGKAKRISYSTSHAKNFVYGEWNRSHNFGDGATLRDDAHFPQADAEGIGGHPRDWKPSFALRLLHGLQRSFRALRWAEGFTSRQSPEVVCAGHLRRSHRWPHTPEL